ncbi:MAG: helix-turn-helix domain-containing protein, partial [Nitrospira sp.]|nr:helix-turn-helix domain-containing protein [Nitrospira sp.]
MESHSKPTQRKRRGPKARRVHIAPPIRKQLTRSSRASTAAVRDSLRANIVLMAGQGISNAEIAERLDCSVRTVRKWRNRFAEQGTVEALADARRSGRPATVPAAVRCELIKLACDRP